MQITKIGGNKSISKKTETKKSDGPSFMSHLSQADNSPNVASASSVSSLMPVDSLLALQEVENNQSGRSKQLSRGHDIVEQLDKIRIGLLEGSVSEAYLKNLDNLINNWRDADSDGDLKELIDEIELRAAVELAKLDMS